MNRGAVSLIVFFLRVWFVKPLGQSRIGTVESTFLSDDTSNLHRRHVRIFGQVAAQTES